MQKPFINDESEERDTQTVLCGYIPPKIEGVHIIHGHTLLTGLNIECMIHEKTTQTPMGRSHVCFNWEN